MTIYKRTSRQQEIIRRLSAGQTLSVLELARELTVSDETIRRELRVLEEKGAIIREHGGARLAPPVFERPLTKQMPEFRGIGTQQNAL